ncbi:hypothetical protein Mx9_p75 [Myxococcus phage Mx9]|nr:hypothetical protein Mx9_p75 [Myxococcus phage Mx9]
MSGCANRPSLSAVFAEFYDNLFRAEPAAFAEVLEIHVSKRLFCALVRHVHPGERASVLVHHGGNGGGIRVKMAGESPRASREKPSDGGRMERNLYDAALKAMAQGIRDAMSEMPEEAKQAERTLYGASAAIDTGAVNGASEEMVQTLKASIRRYRDTYGQAALEETLERVGLRDSTAPSRAAVMKVQTTPRASGCVFPSGHTGQCWTLASVRIPAARAVETRQCILSDGHIGDHMFDDRVAGKEVP